MVYLFDWVADIVGTFDWPDAIASDAMFTFFWQIMLGCTACSIVIISVKTIAKAILKLFD